MGLDLLATRLVKHDCDLYVFEVSRGRWHFQAGCFNLAPRRACSATLSLSTGADYTLSGMVLIALFSDLSANMTRSSISGPEQASRLGNKGGKLTPCPSRLAALLDVLNLVPADANLPDLAKQFSRYALGPVGDEQTDYEGIESWTPAQRVAHFDQIDKDYEERIGGIENAVGAYRMVSSCLENLPEPFRAYLWQWEYQSLLEDAEFFEEDPEDREWTTERAESMRTMVEKCNLMGGASEESVSALRQILSDDEALLDDDRYWDVIRAVESEYTFVRDSREKLWSIIARAKAYARQEKPPFSNFLLDSLFPIKSEATITVSEQGRVVVKGDRFAKAVDGVNVSRLRRCEICSRAFWAGRKDAVCCSPNCADKRRKRQHRARYKGRLAQPGSTAR